MYQVLDYMGPNSHCPNLQLYYLCIGINHILTKHVSAYITNRSFSTTHKLDKKVLLNFPLKLKQIERKKYFHEQNLCFVIYLAIKSL